MAYDGILVGWAGDVEPRERQSVEAPTLYSKIIPFYRRCQILPQGIDCLSSTFRLLYDMTDCRIGNVKRIDML